MSAFYFTSTIRLTQWAFFVLAIFVLKGSLFAQNRFVIVADKDGFVNLRKEPQIGNNVLMRLDNGELLYATGLQGDWCQVRGEKDGQAISRLHFQRSAQRNYSF